MSIFKRKGVEAALHNSTSPVWLLLGLLHVSFENHRYIKLPKTAVPYKRNIIMESMVNSETAIANKNVHFVIPNAFANF